MQTAAAMDKQELRYTRLWGGTRSQGGRGSASKARTKRRITGGVNSSEEYISPRGLGAAIAKKGHQQESRVLSAQHSNRRVSPSAGLSHKTNQTLHSLASPPPLSPRSHSSLGFRETTLPHPQGFNLQEYIKRRGSASDIRIGINGVCSSDEYFEQYLDECEAAAMRCEKRLSSSSSMEELDLVESVPAVTSSSPHPDLVPLCWDDQLRKVQVLD